MHFVCNIMCAILHAWLVVGFVILRDRKTSGFLLISRGIEVNPFALICLILEGYSQCKFKSAIFSEKLK